jgi:hypothetical protein
MDGGAQSIGARGEKPQINADERRYEEGTAQY